MSGRVLITMGRMLHTRPRLASSHFATLKFMRDLISAMLRQRPAIVC